MNPKGYDKLSDDQLLFLLKKGNMRAFNRIYKKYWKRLFTYAYKIFEDKHICEDLVQEVFIKLWRNASESTINNLEAYLFKAVKYQISNNIRRLKWTASHDESLNEVVSANRTESRIELDELQQLVEASVQMLPAKCQEVFRLSRNEHLSNQEIADRLNISIRTVEAHIHQALKLMKGHILNTVISVVIFLGLH